MTQFVLNKEFKSNYYPETVGMVTLILGKAFCGFDGAAFGCFGAFSVGTGEDVRGRFDDCPVYAVALPRMLARS